jgi:hypothetical protein
MESQSLKKKKIVEFFFLNIRTIIKGSKL